MKIKLQILGVLFALTTLAACNRDLSPLNTAASSFPPPPTPSPCALGPDPYMWFNFESDPANYWWWPGGPSPMTQTWANGIASTGCRSWKLVTGTGAGYGHWNGLTFVTPPPIPAGMSQMKISIQINTNLNTTLYIDEGTGNGGQGQRWARSVSFANSAGSFTTYTYPLSGFSTASPGDGVVNTQDVVQVWFYHTAPYASHTLYIDDIRFVP